MSDEEELGFTPYVDWYPGKGDDEEDDVLEDLGTMEEAFFEELELRHIFDAVAGDIYLFLEPHWDKLDPLSDQNGPRNIYEDGLFWCVVEGSASHLIAQIEAWMAKQTHEGDFVFNIMGTDSSVAGVDAGPEVVERLKGILAHWWNHNTLEADYETPHNPVRQMNPEPD